MVVSANSDRFGRLKKPTPTLGHFLRVIPVSIGMILRRALSQKTYHIDAQDT